MSKRISTSHTGQRRKEKNISGFKLYVENLELSGRIPTSKVYLTHIHRPKPPTFQNTVSGSVITRVRQSGRDADCMSHQNLTQKLE